MKEKVESFAKSEIHLITTPFLKVLSHFFTINQWSARWRSFNQRKSYCSAGRSACNMPKGVCFNFNG